MQRRTRTKTGPNDCPPAASGRHARQRCRDRTILLWPGRGLRRLFQDRCGLGRNVAVEIAISINRVHRAMNLPDLYPFVLHAGVKKKSWLAINHLKLDHGSSGDQRRPEPELHRCCRTVEVRKAESNLPAMECGQARRNRGSGRPGASPQQRSEPIRGRLRTASLQPARSTPIDRKRTFGSSVEHCSRGTAELLPRANTDIFATTSSSRVHRKTLLYSVWICRAS